MSVTYTPVTYLDGIARPGTEQSLQENRIDTAFGLLEGAGYTTENLATNAAEILAIKGSPGPPITTIDLINTALFSGTDPGHSHSSISITSLPAHTHAAADIVGEPGTVFAGQVDFAAAVGPGWVAATGIAGTNLINHGVLIATNIADILAMQGPGWTVESIKGNYDLITTGTSPGHLHVASTDLTDFATLALKTDLIPLEGPGWTVESIKGNYDLITTGTSPGHLHPATDITGLSFPGQSDFDALAGAGWTTVLAAAGRNVISIWDDFEAFKGIGHTTETIKANFDISILMQGAGWTVETVKDNFDLITTNTTSITTAQGLGYTNRIDQPTNVTGVTLLYPPAGGTIIGNYNLDFVFVSPGNHTLTWGSGAAVTINVGDGTYQLFDATTVTFINVLVAELELPGSTVTDVSLVVFRMNIKDLYDSFDRVTLSGTVGTHVKNAHGDILVDGGAVVANGIDRQLSITNIIAQVNGDIVIATSPSSITLAGGLLATEGRVDVITIDSGGVFNATLGTVFNLVAGNVFFPISPPGETVVRFVLVSGSRVALFNDDIFTERTVFDFKARWPLISDAKGYHGANTNQLYGRSIEYPANIAGVDLTLYRLFSIESVIVKNPAFTGVTVRQRSVAATHVTYFNTTSPGSYSLIFTIGTGTISWDGGVGVDIVTPAIDATYTLFDSSGVTAIEIDVVFASLPVANQTVSIQIGELPTPAVGRYAISYDGISDFVFDGGVPVNINAVGFYTAQSGTTAGAWIGITVRQPAGLPPIAVVDDVRVYENNLTDLDLKLSQVLLSLLGGTSGASIDGTPSQIFTLGNTSTTGTFTFKWGLVVPTKSVGYYHREQSLSADSGVSQVNKNWIFINDTSGFALGDRISLTRTVPPIPLGFGEEGLIIAITLNNRLELEKDLIQDWLTSEAATVVREVETHKQPIMLDPGMPLVFKRAPNDFYGRVIGGVEEVVFGNGQVRIDGQDLFDSVTGQFGLIGESAGPDTGVITKGMDFRIPFSRLRPYVEWSSNENTLQDHYFLAHFKMPVDCTNFGILSRLNPAAFTLQFTTKTLLTADNQIALVGLWKENYLGFANNNAFVNMITPTATTDLSPNFVDQIIFSSSPFAFDTAVRGGDVITVIIRARAKRDVIGGAPSWVRIHDITLDYMRMPEAF